MIVLQTIAVAFAMFSAIPVPQFDWNEKNMRYAMCAFPLIGVVIGAAWCVCGALPLPGFAKAAGFALIPVWITGGIHKQRADREAAGRLACLLAARAECVVQMFCGIPTVLKGELSQC